MAATQYTPIQIASIDEGQFVGSLAKALAKAERLLLVHIDKHGMTAKSLVKANIEIQWDSKKPGACHILTDVNVQGPKEPSVGGITTALLGSDPRRDDGAQCLLAAAGGTRKDSPRQTVMQEDGEEITG